MAIINQSRGVVYGKRMQRRNIFLIFSAKIYFQKLTTRLVRAIIYRNEQVKYVFY